MKFSESNFKGFLPKYSALLLSDGYSQAAENCELYSGEVRPLLAPSKAALLSLGDAVIQGIYLWRVGGLEYWLRFADKVDVIRSPIADDAYSRIYWSGDSVHDGAVLYSYTPAVYTGGIQYPVNKFKLGIPAPLVAPVASLDIIPPATVSTEARYYVLTYVGKLGEEGPPSPASNRLIVETAQNTVTVTGLAVDDGTQVAREIVTKRLYRTVSGNAGAAFQFVAELPAGQDTYVDILTDDQLAEVIQTTTWDPPREGMIGLGLTPHGSAYGFLGKILCLSELFRPYAWPRGYELTMSDDIVAAGHYDTHIIVATNGRPVMLTGIDPATMSEQQLPIVEACVSKRSMVSMGYCAIYASPNGLVMATASGAQLVTEGIVTRKEWQAINPASIHAYEHRGLYLFFWKTDTTQGGYLFDPRNANAGFRSTDHWYQAGHRDITSDTLFLLDAGGQVWAWEGSQAPLSFRWRSRVFESPRAVQFTVGRVTAASYSNLVLRVYADGQLRHTQHVRNGSAFRMPRGGMARRWEMEIEGTDSVSIVTICQAVQELQS